MTGVTTPGRTLAHEALAYASRGIRVFPLWHAVSGVCACNDGPRCSKPAKHPRTRSGLHEATADMRQVELWWQMWPAANIGLPAEANGLAILDEDPVHGGEAALADLAQWCLDKHRVDILATRTIGTGSGGLHLYYRAPAGGIKSVAKAFRVNGLDTRGRGGYVVAPPSMHASGRPYVVTRDVELQPWPACLSDLMNYRPPLAPQPAPAAGRHRAAGATNAERWARRGLDAECEALRAMTAAGGRNNALNVAAYKIGRKLHHGLSEAEAAQALLAATAGWHDTTEREVRATIVSGLRAGMATPHPGPQRGGQS